ncbi:hypothetical protein TWF481_002958 [Arthrobotrys musiformis]|uniref:HAT C-terminal dimerisation domain-containing protein n=1 Tax=Arthrobotrys musiformis TaxID=47236 RepID=A0AAV9VSW6_9PEZI
MLVSLDYPPHLPICPAPPHSPSPRSPLPPLLPTSSSTHRQRQLTQKILSYYLTNTNTFISEYPTAPPLESTTNFVKLTFQALPATMGKRYPTYAKWATMIAEFPFNLQKSLSIDVIQKINAGLTDGQQTRQNLRDVRKRVEKHLAFEAKYQLR